MHILEQVYGSIGLFALPFYCGLSFSGYYKTNSDFIAKFEQAKYTLTIKHQYKDGDVFATETKELAQGDAYTITPRSIPGYKANIVSGTMPGNDTSVTVLYEKDNDNAPADSKVTVTFKVVGGTWNENDGTELTKTLTLMTDGVWDPAGSAALTEPAATPQDGYKGPGTWNPPLPGTLTADDNGNEYTLTFAVDPEDYHGEISMDSSWAYDGTAHKPTAALYLNDTAVTSFGEPTLTYKDAEGKTLPEPPKDAGSYSVTATWDLDGEPVTVTESFTITKKAVTLTVSPKEKVYDGSPFSTAEMTLDDVTADGFVSEEGLDEASFTVSDEFVDADTYEKAIGVTYTLKTNTKASNYEITTVPGTLTITEKTIDPDAPEASGITVEAPANVTYNGKAQEQKPVVKAGEKVLKENTDYTLSYTDDTTNVGTVTVTVNFKGNYSGSVETSYQITAATVTVTANDKSKVYGENDPDLDATVEGLIGTDTVNYSVTREAGNDVGKYAITPSGDAAQGNYTVQYKPGTLTITMPATADIDVTLTMASWTYGDTPSVPEASAVYHSEGGDIPYASLPSFTYGAADQSGVEVTSPEKPTNVGHYVVIASWPAEKNLPARIESKDFYIYPREVTVTAQPASKTYGDADPTFMATVAGTVNGETVTYSVNREPGEDVGTYSIIPTGDAAQGNYTVSYIPDVFTISQRAITLRSASVSKEYDAKAVPVADLHKVEVVGGSYAEWDKEPGFAFTWRINAEHTVPETMTNEFEARDNAQVRVSNYDITYEYGTMNITTAKLKVYVNNVNKTYGDADPAFTVRYVGFKGNDEQAYAGEGKQYDFVVTPGSTSRNAGRYILTAENRGKGTRRYDVEVYEGLFTINQRPVTVTADSLEKTFGESDPAFTATVAGTVNGETVDYDALTRQEGEVPGSYDIYVTGKADQGNYKVSFVNGTLTINARTGADLYPITVTADSGSATYDGAAHRVDTYTLSTTTFDGAVYTVSNIAADSGEQTNAGVYPVTVTGTPVVTDADGHDVTENFNVTFVDGSLNIAPRSVTLTSATASKMYDGAALTTDAVTVGGEGWADGEGAAYTVAGTQLVPGSSANTFTYTLAPNTLADNYTIEQVMGTLTVTPRTGADRYAITVTGNDGAAMFDGETHRVDGYTVSSTTFDGVTYTLSGITATSGDQRSAGVHAVAITGTPVVTDPAGNDVTENFDLTFNFGRLFILDTPAAEDETAPAAPAAAEPAAPAALAAVAPAVPGPGAPGAPAGPAAAGDAGTVIDDGATPLAAPDADADNAEGEGNDDNAEGGVVITDDDTPLAGGPSDGTNDGTTIEDDETPLGLLDDVTEDCCVLHLLLLLVALAVTVYYTHNRKQHQENQFKLRRELGNA